MYKKLIASLILTALLITGIPVMAASGHAQEKGVVVTAPVEPIVYEERITITKEGGSFKVGFVTLNFMKEFLSVDQLPTTFDIRVYAVDGEPGIEINPDTEKFLKKVLIKVDKYNGYLYDKAKGKNVYFSIKPQAVVARHFSWYRFR